MSEKSEFKTWAIVEVMGHVEYAGFVTAETIAGSAMLRVWARRSESRPNAARKVGHLRV
jgi:hypothetical protein